jgi:hypothetical protein
MMTGIAEHVFLLENIMIFFDLYFSFNLNLFSQVLPQTKKLFEITQTKSKDISYCKERERERF